MISGYAKKIKNKVGDSNKWPLSQRTWAFLGLLWRRPEHPDYFFDQVLIRLPDFVQAVAKGVEKKAQSGGDEAEWYENIMNIAVYDRFARIAFIVEDL